MAVRPRPLPTFAAIAVMAVALAGFVPRRHMARCPAGSVLLEGALCVDLYEGSLVEVLGRNRTRPWSPHTSPAVGGHYRAQSKRGVTPQAFISRVQAGAACAAAGKRLCSEAEWTLACKGPDPTQWPYGPTQMVGRCNDDGINPVPRLYGGGDVFHDHQMNDPRLNTLPRTVSRTGTHARCRGRYGIFDMVGNLHEWVQGGSGGRGVFRGGFFADVLINGHGCDYATRAHSPTYRGDSTGFRCCGDALNRES